MALRLHMMAVPLIASNPLSSTPMAPTRQRLAGTLDPAMLKVV